MASPSPNQLVPSKPVFWRDPAIRGIFYQILAVCALLGSCWYLFNNTLINMEARGIQAGFDWLGAASGFEINFTLIDYSATSPYWSTFVVGLLNTLLVAGVSIFFATIIGFLAGIARLSSNWLIARIALVYIEIVRNVPLLLQIFFWYIAVLGPLPRYMTDSFTLGPFALNKKGLWFPTPIFESGFGIFVISIIVAIIGVVMMNRWATKRQEQTGEQFPTLMVGLGVIIGLPALVFIIMGMPLAFEDMSATRFRFSGAVQVIPELVALAIALSMYTAAFIAEIVRSGIEAVSHGQTEAARALGLRPAVTLRLVIIPQAMRVIIPPLTSQYLNLTKNSSLATAIGYPDLVAVFMGTTLNQSGQAVVIIGITMAVYLALSLITSAFMNWFNSRMALVER